MKNKCIAAMLFVLIILCMPVFAAEGELAAERPGIFSGSIADAIWTVIAFVILVSVLGKLAWKPLLAGLKAREERIRQEIMNAENARHLADKALADYNRRLSNCSSRHGRLPKKRSKMHKKKPVK